MFKGVLGSTAAKIIASKLASAAQTEVGKKAFEAGKNVVKEIALKTIDVGEDVAIAKQRRLALMELRRQKIRK